MQNTDNYQNLWNISCVCKTPEDLIKSADFIRVIDIILNKLDKFDINFKESIKNIFAKLTKIINWEIGDNEDLWLSPFEKNLIIQFFKDPEVIDLWNKILKSLKNQSINIDVKNISEFNDFSKMINNIFSDKWIENIQKYVGQVAWIVELTISKYDNSNKINIQDNWEVNVVHIENRNFNIDSSKWKDKITIRWKIYKINPERDIIETNDSQQLFTYEAALRETQNNWRRLPRQWYRNWYISTEFEQIISKIGIKEFKKHLPWYTNPWDFPEFIGLNLESEWLSVCYWADWEKLESDWKTAMTLTIDKSDDNPNVYWDDKKIFCSVRSIII